MNSDFSSFTAVIGIDWADRKHDVCVQSMGSGERKFARISHKVEQIDEWAQSLYARHGGPMAVAVELSKGPIVSALQQYAFFVIYPINPTTLARYREAFNPSGSKDDPTDAELAVDLLLSHTDRFKPLNPQSVEMRALTLLVEQRRRVMNERVRTTNRLRNALKQYYPQALDWVNRIDTPLFCALIRQWPTLAKIKRARKATLEKFFRDHHMYRPRLLAERIESIRSAVPLTTDDAVITPYSLLTLTLVDQLEVALSSIDRYDQAIAELASQHPDYELFSSLPGAGPALAPRLLVAFGEQRDRFASAAAVQNYVGIAPVTERSGQKHWVHWRWQCPKFLRQTFVEWAAQTINKSYWAGLYYHQQRAKGSSYQAAVRSLAFKWIRILYRCWVTRTPYDEAKYLNVLKQRGSPLLITETA